jgi:hypothetical protein
MALRARRYGESGERRRATTRRLAMQFMVSMITDGPFAESKEQFAGYMVLECEDLDEAVRWVERIARPSRLRRGAGDRGVRINVERA